MDRTPCPPAPAHSAATSTAHHADHAARVGHGDAGRAHAEVDPQIAAEASLNSSSRAAAPARERFASPTSRTVPSPMNSSMMVETVGCELRRRSSVPTRPARPGPIRIIDGYLRMAGIALPHGFLSSAHMLLRLKGTGGWILVTTEQRTICGQPRHAVCRVKSPFRMASFPLGSPQCPPDPLSLRAARSDARRVHPANRSSPFACSIRRKPAVLGRQRPHRQRLGSTCCAGRGLRDSSSGALRRSNPARFRAWPALCEPPASVKQGSG